MNNEEKFKLIEKTIKDAKGDYSIDRLIQDCADKLSINFIDVKNILIEFDSDLREQLNSKTKPHQSIKRNPLID